jgi:hypothetical protein
MKILSAKKYVDICHVLVKLWRQMTEARFLGDIVMYIVFTCHRASCLLPRQTPFLFASLQLAVPKIGIFFVGSREPKVKRKILTYNGSHNDMI